MSYKPSAYYNEEAIKRAVEKGRHRRRIGGRWDEMGELQFKYLSTAGLLPKHRFIDVGCGCLRAGVWLVNYLHPGNSFGIDISKALLEAGRHELEAVGLSDRLPAENLQQTEDFSVNFDATFDYGLAQSVFTHLPFNHLRLCLLRLAPFFETDGRFFATVFLVADSEWYESFIHKVGGIETFPDKNPFHFTRHDLEHCTDLTGWRIDLIADWGHPRGQTMVGFKRTE